jgi:hypothetical protein
MLCRHCQRGSANRPRGLCWSCYYSPGVRKKYPSTSRFARWGLANYSQRKRLALPQPTAALPGTPEKVAVLMERVRRKQALWHPQDAHINKRGDLVGVRRLVAG